MKRTRESSAQGLTRGTQVRLVDLPAYPGLEGQLGEVVNLDDKDVDVRLLVNGVVKRVCFLLTSLNIPLGTTRQS
jgi:hypothetical protein